MNKFMCAAIIAIFPIFGACSSTTSSPMDAGQRISQRGNQISGYGESWTAGQQASAKGSRMIEKSSKDTAEGEKRLDHARDLVAEAQAQIKAAEANKAKGEQLISDGTAQMQRAEANYSAARAGQSALGANPESPN